LRPISKVMDQCGYGPCGQCILDPCGKAKRESRPRMRDVRPRCVFHARSCGTLCARLVIESRGDFTEEEPSRQGLRRRPSLIGCGVSGGIQDDQRLARGRP